jgi:hypothetical protein
MVFETANAVSPGNIYSWDALEELCSSLRFCCCCCWCCCYCLPGNVYSWDALEELCIKPKNWKDLLTEEPFTRKDIIHLQVRQEHSVNPGCFRSYRVISSAAF